MKSDYCSLKDIPKTLGICQGETVYLASDIMALAFTAQLNGENFVPDNFIDCFKEALGKAGTLLIPTFNFDFSDIGEYDYRIPKCFTGALGIAALKRKDFKRTYHPMHSFAVWGKEANVFLNMDNKNSFGLDSPFGYMHRENAIMVMLGTDYTRAFTFAHYCETQAHVPYRFYKEFVGNYTDEYGNTEIRKYEYPARYLEFETTEQFNRIGSVLEEKKLARRFIINNIPMIVMRLGDCFDVVYNDAKNNMARNLYDFGCSREMIYNKYT